MKCPKCQADMNSLSYQDVVVDRCQSCHGIWLDKRELDVVFMKKLSSAFDLSRVSEISVVANDREAHCHRCDAPMIALDGADDVRFDWCEQCGGMFFDSGELSRLDAFLPDDGDS